MKSAPHPSSRQKYLYTHTFGCQMNEYDSLRVQRALSARGYACTDIMEQADVIFINTCSVREKAEQKVHSFVGRLRKLKNRKPSLKIVVGGCVAQQLGEKLTEKFDHLDIVVGTRGVHAIGDLLDQHEWDRRQRVHLPGDAPEDIPYEHGLPEKLSAKVTAPVTIMQGCNNFCTYCIVPHVRGPEKSRPPDHILLEIQALESSGVREVLLLGQNVNSYGKGLGENTSFVDLLRRIQAETQLLRLRFTTSHPKDLTTELMEAFAELPMLCKNLHLPFQSGSDRILARMNRNYSSVDYLRKIDHLRRICPEMGLSSDVMVGFPGETEEDFQDTLRLMERVRFDNLFSFQYSDRPMTQSVNFPHKIPKSIKTRRLTQLQALQARITLEKNLAEIGKRHNVLAEGKSRSGDGQITGRTEQNRAVNFSGPLSAVGSLVRVEIKEAFSHSLKGQLIS